jgi:D-xylose transport system ATP-binding protein
MEKQPLVNLQKITKKFPGNYALKDVHLKIYPGEVVALMGENGAGKSTLMKILTGIWPAGTYEGQIFIGNNPVEFFDTQDASDSGIAIIHQELAIFPELTVAEHLELTNLKPIIQWSPLKQRVQKFLDFLEFDLKADTQVRELSIGGKQLVEIARALYKNSKVIIFDEPTTALTEQEATKLYGIIERLRLEGHGIIYISHRMDEVFKLADRIVVLRDGQNAGEIATTSNNQIIPRGEIEPQLIKWMVGREIHDVYPPKSEPSREDLLRVENLTVKKKNGERLINNLSFSLKKGEILGLAGLLGAGRTETLQAIFGAFHPDGPHGDQHTCTGNAWLNNKRFHISGSRSQPFFSIISNVGLVTEERKTTGLFTDRSIRENMTLPTLRISGNMMKTISKNHELNDVQTWAKKMAIRCQSLDQNVSELSGGNQQKVILAKWLMTNPQILFLDEPTRGIDIGAKSEIYHWIQQLAAQGIGIILVSSEMPELLGLSHRILVLKEGRLSAELRTQDTNQEEMMRASTL